MQNICHAQPRCTHYHYSFMHKNAHIRQTPYGMIPQSYWSMHMSYDYQVMQHCTVLQYSVPKSYKYLYQSYSIFYACNNSFYTGVQVLGVLFTVYYAQWKLLLSWWISILQNSRFYSGWVIFTVFNREIRQSRISTRIHWIPRSRLSCTAPAECVWCARSE